MLQLLDNSPKIQQLANEGIKVPYPFYNKETKKADFKSQHIYKRDIDWWTQDLADVVIPIILIFLIILRPDLSALGYNIGYMWLLYLILIALDRKLTLGKVPYGFYIEVFACSIQAFYTVYYLFGYKKENDSNHY